jgi:hypothetical protein
MPVGAQNDTELSRRQSNLESFEGNKILKLLACALRQGLNRGPVDHAREQQVHLPFLHFLFPKGSR